MPYAWRMQYRASHSGGYRAIEACSPEARILLGTGTGGSEPSCSGVEGKPGIVTNVVAASGGREVSRGVGQEIARFMGFIHGFLLCPASGSRNSTCGRS